MSEAEIRPGALVRHGRGVGKVVSVGTTEVASELLETADIEFWGSDNSKVLQRTVTPLPADSPEALLWDQPAALVKWAEEAPLRLVAAALSVSGGVGKVADIREKLEGRTISADDWSGWWKRVQPKVKAAGDHFTIGDDKEYRLRTAVDVVPEGPTIELSQPGSSKPKGAKFYQELLERERQSYERQLKRQQRELESQRADYELRMERQRQGLERRCVALSDELEALRQSHEAEMERERQEQERLRQQVRERNAELAANREESRLEIRQDMLLAVGEVIQSVSSNGDSGEMAASVQSGLNLALRAGDAEPLGTPGEVAPYDREIHQLENDPKDGGLTDSSPVVVIAPGVVVRGGIHGDRVLLKAQVKHEAG